MFGSGIMSVHVVILVVQRWLDKFDGAFYLVDTVIGGGIDIVTFLNTLGRVGWLFVIFLNRFKVNM